MSLSKLTKHISQVPIYTNGWAGGTQKEIVHVVGVKPTTLLRQLTRKSDALTTCVKKSRPAMALLRATWLLSERPAGFSLW